MTGTQDMIAARSETATLAIAGLTATRKTLPPSLFYDLEGCRLFYEITKLPEYYLTRAEAALLASAAPKVASMQSPGTVLVEYGASDETKAETLLRQANTAGAPVFQAYVPVDVAHEALTAMRDRLARRFPELRVLPLRADFMHPITLPALPDKAGVLGFFPGSTIGNLEPAAAAAFLDRTRQTLGANARLLLGFDTNRDPARLIPAYDDAQGVTAAFNRNLLSRLNREAGGRFDPEAFAHRAVWNAAESRIEMHLVSHAAQTIEVSGHKIHFARNETIHTENSYKYEPSRMRALAGSAGWTPAQTWTDPEGLFALWLLE